VPFGSEVYVDHIMQSNNRPNYLKGLSDRLMELQQSMRVQILSKDDT